MRQIHPAVHDKLIPEKFSGEMCEMFGRFRTYRYGTMHTPIIESELYIIESELYIFIHKPNFWMIGPVVPEKRGGGGISPRLVFYGFFGGWS